MIEKFLISTPFSRLSDYSITLRPVLDYLSEFNDLFFPVSNLGYHFEAISCNDIIFKCFWLGVGKEEFLIPFFSENEHD